MTRKKITYIISDIDKALAFEWVADYISKERFELTFIILNPKTSDLELFLKDHAFDVYPVLCRGKKDWPQAIHKVYKQLKVLKPDIVHCHLLQANIIGLIAAKLANVKNRIYTRHHSSQHHVYHPKGVWWDKLANGLATKIIAISGIVKRILIEWEKVPEEKVVLIPHGFLLQEYFEVQESRVDDFKMKYDINGKWPVVGVISRFTELKGIQYIIPAFIDLRKEYPEAILLLLNAYGDYENFINKMLESLPETSVRLIRFEKDIAAAYKAMDVFIHVPIDDHSEAFGQIYIEALAAGTPSIFTKSGIANEAYFNNEVASIVPFKNAEAIHHEMQHILSDKNAHIYKKSAGQQLAKKFDLSNYINQLELLYSE